MTDKSTETFTEKKPAAKGRKKDPAGSGGKLRKKDLNKVSGGAFPTRVNDQITDSVTQVGGDDGDG